MWPQNNSRYGQVKGEPRRFIHGHNRASAGKLFSHADERPFPPPNPSGLCMCGCGTPTLIAKRAVVSQRIEKGQHARYITGHNPTQGQERPYFNQSLGRWMISRGGKPMYRYRAVAEEMLGRPLRPGEQVHHINGDPTDDRPENLEVLSAKEHAARHPEKPNPPSNWKPDAFYIEKMRAWIATHGRRPKQREIDADPAMPDSTTYRERFGSLSAAVAAARR